METNFTQGEWLTSEGAIYSQETGKTLALIPYFDKKDKEQEANAKLIAASPELLHILKQFHDHFAGNHAYREKLGINEIYNQAGQIIYKATK